jgi:arginase
MRIAVLDAPTNLGLRPPTANSVPGCAKAPGALRDHGLVARLGARDAGCLTPPRFDPGDWRPGDGVSQATEIARYSTRLADRIGAILLAGEFPLILGGDCSVVLGSTLAMKRLEHERGGRVGLIYVDAHSDFRHPGNASVVGAAAGEALALVTGRGQGDLASIEQRRPYVRDSDVVLVGMRSTDDYRMDLQAGGFNVRTAQDVRTYGANRTAQWARSLLGECLGYWVHLDVDVLDPSAMPAVDAPAPGGIAYAELENLLQGLVTVPECLGIEVTVFDPDFDADGVYAQDLVNTLVTALTPVSRPPVVAIPAQAKRSPRTRRTPASP